MDITNTKLQVQASTFYRNKGNFESAVLKEVQSNVTIQHTNFSRNFGHNGVIEIANGSSLSLDNSVFEDNDHWFFALSTIIIKSKSSATVKHCMFVANIAVHGAGLCSMANTSIIVENSTFVNNSGQMGSSINCNDDLNLKSVQNRSIAKLIPRTFPALSLNIPDTVHYKPVNNYTWHNYSNVIEKSKVPATINTEEHSKCTIHQSIFKNNEGYGNGGAIYVQGRVAEIFDSSFGYIKGGFTGGAISSFQKARVKITNSSFLNNQTIFGSTVSAQESAVMFINNSNFSYLDTRFFTGFSVHASNSSSMTFLNSNFSNMRTVARILDI